MRSVFNDNDNQKAVINLPARNDNESEIESDFTFHAGELTFEGQQFVFPEGFTAHVASQWLEESLLLVSISISGELTAECARCLKPVNLEISEKLLYLYYSRGSDSDLDLDLESDSKEFGGYMPVELDYFARVLDVMPQIQESVYTLLPTKVLCSENCKGLCPNCGADLNEGKCSCVIEQIDPRLESLRNFIIE